MLDQRKLPREETYVTLRSVEEVAQAIETMVVRGAPAIGCAAALGIALAATTSRATGADALRVDVEAASERLARTRPTAVNLFWGLGRMREAFEAALVALRGDVAGVRARLVAAAEAIVAEDVETCRAIGRSGLAGDPGERAPAHALQRGRARDGRLRHRARRRACRVRGRPAAPRVRRRDAPVPAGRAPHRVGAARGRASRSR